MADQAQLQSPRSRRGVQGVAVALTAVLLIGAAGAGLREAPRTSDYLAMAFSPGDADSTALNWTAAGVDRRMSLTLAGEATPRPGLPDHLTVLGLTAKGEGAARLAGETVARAAGPASVDGVYAALGPRWIQPDQSRRVEGAGDPAYRLVVLSSPAAGREAEYNDWYDHQHLPDVMRAPGFHAAQRYRLIRQTGGEGFPLPRYAVVFELSSRDIDATRQDIRRRVVSGVTRMSAAFDNTTVVSRYYRVDSVSP